MQHCPKCKSNSCVIDSRVQRSGNIHRRRKCLSCGVRWNTLEITVERATQLDIIEATLLRLKRAVAKIALDIAAL